MQGMTSPAPGALQGQADGTFCTVARLHNAGSLSALCAFSVLFIPDVAFGLCDRICVFFHPFLLLFLLTLDH